MDVSFLVLTNEPKLRKMLDIRESWMKDKCRNSMCHLHHFSVNLAWFQNRAFIFLNIWDMMNSTRMNKHDEMRRRRKKKTARITPRLRAWATEKMVAAFTDEMGEPEGTYPGWEWGEVENEKLLILFHEYQGAREAEDKLLETTVHSLLQSTWSFPF